MLSKNYKQNLKPARKTNGLSDKLKSRFTEAIFIVITAVSLFLLLSLLTYHTSDPCWSHVVTTKRVANLGGFAGAWFADILICILGYTAFILPISLAYIAWVPCRFNKESSEVDDEKKSTIFFIKSSSFLLLLLSASSLIKLNLNFSKLPFGSGGVVGNLFGDALLNFLSTFATNLLLFALLLSSFTLFSGFSWLKFAERLGNSLTKLADFLGRQILRAPKVKAKERIELIPEVIDVSTNPLQQEPKAVIVPAAPIKSSRRAIEEKQLKIFEPELVGSLPSLSLLDLPDQSPGLSYSHEQLEKMSSAVERHLQEFNIEAKVMAVHPGPVITRFELELAAGTKVSRITALAKDLARSLSVISVRIVEVIPGKSVIGLELPNEYRETVRLREILSSQQYETARAPLTIALGKDISGHPVIVDLAKMPHLLVAGTTGSGKSVCLHALLLSLLYKYTTKEVRLILIDPKMLEMSAYDGIPHLLAPVVTDMKDATCALRWCVMEMERRYKLLAALGVRNISGFNHKIKEAQAQGKPVLDPLWQEGGEEENPKELQELPYIVVLADEYADMIMVVGKKVEELIARIAQKSRAAGIHLVLATQRPSVDVITGLIKANISTRIALQASSKIDSRTILDQPGAEQLLGFGDMLYLPPGSGVPIRVHGAFVSDEEVHKVAKDLKRRAIPEYVDEILTDNWSNQHDGFDTPAFDAANGFLNGGQFSSEKDPLYDQAVEIVVETRRASISQIQRRLRIGYNRAARMVEDMEKAGLVSPMEVNGNREVLVPKREQDL